MTNPIQSNPCIVLCFLQADVQSTRMALQGLEGEHNGLRQKLQSVLNGWYDCMTAIAPDLRCEVSGCSEPHTDTLDESLGSLRILDTSLRANAKALASRCETLLTQLHTTENELASRMEDISGWKLRVSQYEEDAGTYERNIVELQESNQSLQSALDSLSREMAAVTAAGQFLLSITTNKQHSVAAVFSGVAVVCCS